MPKAITSTLLADIRVGFNTSFRRGLGQVESQRGMISTTIPSSTASNTYGWLGKFPNMREWLGDRVIHGMQEHGYSIRNRDFELTIGVDRNDIKDENLGVYDPLFVDLGESVSANPDQLSFGALRNGFNSECYDGQAFFDTDHPVMDETGKTVSVSNVQVGTGKPWFLMDDRRALKPIIYQEREVASFVSLDNPTDPNVFNRKEFVYGVDGRWNVGYGFWQMCVGSQLPLTADNLKAAHTTLSSMTGDHGRKLGMRGTLLVVDTDEQFTAKELLENQLTTGGATNTMRGTSKLLVADWL